MKLNLIAGLPRSGSTLLCNILNQNPRFQATTTSILPSLCAGVSNFCSNSIEYKADLDKSRTKAQTQLGRAIEGLVQGWNSVYEKEVIFDKSRGWIHNFLMMQSIYPEIKMIVMIRDLRSVFASIEKQNRKTALFCDAQNPVDKTINARASKMFSAQGIIGGPIVGIRDMIQRKPQGVIFLQYESLAENPSDVMKTLYETLGEEYFEHDFKNVKNTAQDPDGLYLHKYPHKGDGEVKPSKIDWQQFVPYDIVKEIMGRFEFFNQTFGYC